MQSSITLVSIATGDPDLLNAKTVNALKKKGRVFLRTSQSPIVSWLKEIKIPFSSLDNLYDSAEDFDHLSSAIAEHLWAQACISPVVYAVPDLMVDSSVQELYRLRPVDGNIVVVPGIGLSDVLQSSVRPLLLSSDLRTLSASDFLLVDYDPNTSVLITELDNPILAGDVKIRLSAFLDDEYRVFFLGNADSQTEISLYELDRQPNMDHLSAVYIPGRQYCFRNNFTLSDLERIMDQLRDAQTGCPWDRKQTSDSLKEYIIEEAWETVGAIEDDDPEKIADELGDLLFQIIFQAAIGKSKGDFDIRDVLNHICRKMIRRHPHVFQNESCNGERELNLKWEEIKRIENGCSSVSDSLNNISLSLPSLRFTQKLFKKISLLNLQGSTSSEILNRISELIVILNTKKSCPDSSVIGELLLNCAFFCQTQELDGETLLHNTAQKYRDHMIESFHQGKESRSINNETASSQGGFDNEVR